MFGKHWANGKHWNFTLRDYNIEIAKSVLQNLLEYITGLDFKNFKKFHKISLSHVVLTSPSPINPSFNQGFHDLSKTPKKLYNFHVITPSKFPPFLYVLLNITSNYKPILVVRLHVGFIALTQSHPFP